MCCKNLVAGQAQLNLTLFSGRTQRRTPQRIRMAHMLGIANLFDGNESGPWAALSHRRPPRVVVLSPEDLSFNHTAQFMPEVLRKPTLHVNSKRGVQGQADRIGMSDAMA